MTEQETLFVAPLAVLLEDTLPLYARQWASRRSREYMLTLLYGGSFSGGNALRSSLKEYLEVHGPLKTSNMLTTAVTILSITMRDWLDHIATADAPLAKRISDNTVRMTLRQAEDKAYNWHIALRKRQRENAVEPPGASEDYLTLEGGWKWVRILTAEGLDFEGAVMGHCVGRGGYDGASIYSLRDGKGRPHVTAQLAVGSCLGGVVGDHIVQARGRVNADVAEEHVPMMREFIRRRRPRCQVGSRNSFGFVTTAKGRLLDPDCVEDAVEIIKSQWPDLGRRASFVRAMLAGGV